MAQWYRDEDERERSRRYGAWRDRWEQSPRERGMFDRGTDEVRSWFGDDDAERRRQVDRRWEDDRYERSGSWSDRASRRDWRDDDRERYGARRESQYDWESSPARRSPRLDRGRDNPSDWNASSGRSEYRGAPVSWTYTEVWMIPGPHVGRGPNGYTRSDDRIREDICDRLTQHGLIDASQVDVAVASGEVTLRGYVPDRESKRRAEDVAESVFGVNDVRNELRTSDGRLEAGRQHEAEGERNLESPLGISGTATPSAPARKNERQSERV
jgi:osmotically-inducible protein OsmY